jgi:hypothetical protein
VASQAPAAVPDAIRSATPSLMLSSAELQAPPAAGRAAKSNYTSVIRSQGTRVRRRAGGRTSDQAAALSPSGVLTRRDQLDTGITRSIDVRTARQDLAALLWLWRGGSERSWLPRASRGRRP